MGRPRVLVFRLPGFSLIELMVCIGIVLILIGLMLPAIGRSREQAIRTRNLASIRGAFVFLSQYTTDNGEYYPVGGDDPVSAAKLWYLPLLSSGHIDSWRNLGIPSREFEQSLIGLTQTAIISQTIFTPGGEEHLLEQPVDAQRTNAIVFPSEKGILFQHFVDTPDTPETVWCCLRDAPLAPVSFGDGSGVICTYKQFDVQPPPELYRNVGTPVVASWFGLSGRDVLN